MKHPFVASFDPLVVALPIAVALVITALALAGWRLWRGPTDADRVLALDLMTGIGLAMVVVAALAFDQAVYLDVAVAVAVIGFVGTTALARRLEKGDRS